MKSNKLVIGVLAHVDSGKTTLAESILFQTGSIRKYGRVDHQDSFFDNNNLERDRGITIFSKQAKFVLGKYDVTLLDTPGHVDFSAEMERTLQVLDYAILIVSATDGVQAHTKTLWSLLKRYKIPVYIFVNKMDQNGNDKQNIMRNIQKELSSGCIDFIENEKEYFYDQLAMCSEALMNEYLEKDVIEKSSIQNAIENREVFPCIFGSALKQEGTKELLEVIEMYSKEKEYRDVFSARVFKVTRDEQNIKLIHLKITGGSLKVKENVVKSGKNDCENEKVNQIRIYSGSQYVTKNEAFAGEICAVTGINTVRIGDGLGEKGEKQIPTIEPALTYSVTSNNGCDNFKLYALLQLLEEEDPMLHVYWDKKLDEIQLQLMGEVQTEILQKIVKERYLIDISFGEGKIVYKETVRGTSIGIGHFEPLRHYAEVHLKIEPLERGSGIVFETDCSEDILAKNWQRLILTHLGEKEHIGILTGSLLTDVKITITNGRAHIKHTEGGDFRQATYRALRQGLHKNENILLEPIYQFELKVPRENIGRAMTDIQKMYGSFEEPDIEGENAIIIGKCPVATMKNYQKEVLSYTRGQGKLTCQMQGYDICHNQEEVIELKKYDADSDLDNPASSVFCSHGAGFVVPWEEVDSYAHIKEEQEKDEIELDEIQIRKRFIQEDIAQEEIDEIFQRTFGNAKQKRVSWNRVVKANDDENYKGKEIVYKNKDEYLLVDGYNIIFAWPELKALSDNNIDSARDKLMDILSNYQGYRKCNLILVFDAYKVSGGQGSVFDYHNIHVVYTKEAETADQYIEKITHEIGKKYQVTVATSDRLEQMIIFGAGAKRVSAKGLLDDVKNTQKQIQERMKENNDTKSMHHLLDQLTEEDIKKMKDND